MDADELIQQLNDVLVKRAPLAAVYGPFGTFDHVRKTLLASCRDAHRMTRLGNGEKVTEALLDDLAHADGQYVDFINAATEQRTALALLDAESTILEHRLSYLKARQYMEGQMARLA